MFRRKTTITSADRDRLVEVTRTKANVMRWALFVDQLQREINSAKFVEPECVAPDIVTMHSKVRLVDLTKGGEEIYTLVYPDEMDLSVGRLSVLSPLGTVLLGCREGDVVSVVGSAGPRPIKVQELLYQPEAAARQGVSAR
jgi:regulator of nucleoside diphosphate kinase